MRFTSLMLALPLVACGTLGENEANGSPQTNRQFQVQGFDRVANAAPADVEISTGGEFAVNASGSQKLVDALDIRVENGVLRIRTKKDSRWGWSGNQGSAKVTIVMPRIQGASISGAGDMTIDRGVGDFRGEISGAGDMTIGELKGGKVSLSISGAGDLGAAGTAEQANLVISGTGSVHGKELRTRFAKVTVSGTGSVDASVDGDADVVVSGVGSVDLGNRARCRIRKSGIGDVTCGG